MTVERLGKTISQEVHDQILGSFTSLAAGEGLVTLRSNQRPVDNALNH